MYRYSQEFVLNAEWVVVVVVIVAAALLVDRFGRRTLFITSNAGMCVGETLHNPYIGFLSYYMFDIAFSMWTLTTALFQRQEDGAAGKATMGILFVFYFFYDLAYTPMLIGWFACYETYVPAKILHFGNSIYLGDPAI